MCAQLTAEACKFTSTRAANFRAMNIFGFGRPSVDANTASDTLDKLAVTLKTASRVEDIRAAVNALFDLNNAKTVRLDAPIVEGIARVLSDFKSDFGLVTSVLGIVAEHESMDRSTQDVFVRAGGIEACTELLKMPLSTSNRLHVVSFMGAVINVDNAMHFIIAITPLVDILGSGNDILQSGALKLLTRLLAQPANVSELQKIAVFSGAIEHCFKLAAENEDAWMCIKLLLARNTTTRQTFLAELNGIGQMRGQCGDRLSVKSGIVMVGILSMLLEQSSKPAKDALKRQMAEFKDIVVAMAKPLDSKEQQLLNRSIFAFLAQLLDPGALLPAEFVAFVTKAALEGSDANAARLHESVIRMPVDDLSRPLSFRLLASSGAELDPAMLLAAIRSGEQVGALYCFIVRSANLLADSIIVQLLIEQVMIDDGLVGGLAACLLLCQLDKRNSESGGYTAAILRQIIQDRIGHDTIAQRIDKICDDDRLNYQKIAPFIDKGRRLLSEEAPALDPAVLLRENEELKKQTTVYREQLLAMEQEHAELLAVLGQYDAEIAHLRSLLPAASTDELSKDSRQAISPSVLDADPLEELRKSLIIDAEEQDDKEWIERLLASSDHEHPSDEAGDDAEQQPQIRQYAAQAPSFEQFRGVENGGRTGAPVEAVVEQVQRMSIGQLVEGGSFPLASMLTEAVSLAQEQTPDHHDAAAINRVFFV